MTPNEQRPERDHDQAIEAHERERGPVEEFAGGEIRTYHGIVNRWLLLVYAGLAVWGLYYLFTSWGGLGPGLAR